jgi:hypothetical protein
MEGYIILASTMIVIIIFAFRIKFEDATKLEFDWQSSATWSSSWTSLGGALYATSTYIQLS